jgi:hypothetical protein
MASPTTVTPRGAPDSGSDPDASYDMADHVISPALPVNSETRYKKERDEEFIDLQLDADLQSIRSEILKETQTILRIMDDFHLTDEKAVPLEIRIRLRKHARAIASFFGDDVGIGREPIPYSGQFHDLLLRRCADFPKHP